MKNQAKVKKMTIKAIEMPHRNEYGALELKQYINKSTVKGFLITVSLLLLFFVYYLITSSAGGVAEAPPLAPINKLELLNTVDAPAEEAAPPPPPPVQQMAPSGPAARAGTPTPIPDAEIAPDMQEFASMDDLDRASSMGSEGIDMGDFASNIDWENQGNVNVKATEELPDPDEFIPVEKQPGMDIAELQRLVEYPRLAKEAGIEGRVIVKALINKKGQVLKTLVEYSDNQLLNEAAINAIKDYKNFTPAIQNGQPVTIWVSIPLKFKLR